jgi:hypothetical protein
VVIKKDITFTGIGISFGKKIDSDVTTGTGRKLIIKSGVTSTTSTGDITIGDEVGGGSIIDSVDMTGKDIDIHSVFTAKSQLYTPSGRATIDGDYEATDGSFKISGNTSLGGSAAVTTDGTQSGGVNNDITFTGTINGNHTLNLQAQGPTEVKVGGAVGGTAPLGGFIAAAKTIDVVSVKTKKAGAETGVISLKVDPATTSEDFDDDKGQTAQAVTPTGTIKLHGGLESAGGDIVLGVTGTRDEDKVLTFPSITIEPPSAGTATISGRNVTMGKNEKLVVNGSVKIVATDEAKLSDITASDSIEVTAPTITIQQRKDGTVFDSLGNTLLHDLNTDFVARNSIKFDGDVQVEGTIDQTHRVLFATVGGDVDVNASGTSVLFLGDEPPFSINLGGVASAAFIDLRASGSSVTNPAAALAGAAPQESRQPEVENAVASSQAIELRNLGIFARDMDRSSLIGFLEGIILYNDVPGRIASGDQLPREQYQVTKNRLSYDGARRVLDLYYSTYFQTDEYGRPIMKNGKRVENITAMNKAIEDAIAAYRAKTGQKTGSIDPVAFREYVETTPSQGEALKHMNKLRNLFNEILPVGQTGSRKGLGLTPVEAAISRKVLVESLGVQGMEPEKLEASILANTGRTGAARPAMNPAAKPAGNSTAKPAIPPANRPEPKPTLSPIPKPE